MLKRNSISPTFPSILKFITIHQPAHILSVLPKPLGNAEKRSFLSQSNHHLDISIHGNYFKAYTTLVSTIIYHKFT